MSILAANAIVNLADVKEYLKIDTSVTSEDNLLEGLINSVSDLFEKYCGSMFINQSITETLDGPDKSVYLFLRSSPVVSLTSISFDGTPQTLSDYTIKKTTGELYSNVGDWPKGFQNIVVIYTTGWGVAIANLPTDLKLAAKKQVEYFYKRDVADFSTTFSEGMVIKAPAELLSPTVKGMLAMYYKIRL